MLQKDCINTWPPPYKIRMSHKAKYIHLRITPTTGLEIVVPSCRKRFNIPMLLEERRAWIEKNLKLMQQSAQNKSTAHQLPKILPLNAIHEIWQISYIETNSKNTKFLEKANYHLTIYGELKASIIQALLINWLKKRAKKVFSTKLAAFSNKIIMPYQNLTIRGQKTLWGSCNAKRNISLNFKLLFLPASVFNYVLLHELCHTKYLNHSNKFWDLLAQYDNNYLSHDKELKNGDQYVPQWILNYSNKL